MQFDDFDKKIKEAAEHHHPAYEDKAWGQMEKLLDKHLPVEKDDRRRIIFLLLFLLLGGLGVYLGISKPWQQKKSNTSTKNIPVSVPVNEKSDAGSTGNLTKKENNETTGKTLSLKTPIEKATIDPEENKSADKVTESKKTVTPSLHSDPNEQRQIKETVVSNYRIKKAKDKIGLNKYLSTQKVANLKNLKSNTASVSNGSEKTETQNNTPEENDNLKSKDLNTVNSNKPADSTRTIDQANTTVTVTTDSVLTTKTADVVKPDSGQKKEEPIVQKSNAKPHPGKQRKSVFAITFTTGPDLSAVGLHEAGKVKIAYGAGLSYSLNRFTIRSGFYVSKKVYTAGPEDYHPPQHNWIYYVDLTEVDADCKVYEIPVTVSYTFSESKRHSWFASTGLSSYLMKKETYGYYYKNSASQPMYKNWTLKNGENHVFSILNLSAGYERKLNKTFSVIAEPYLKIPMDGIGFGSIKLNSVGLFFTLSIKPFAK